MNIFKLALRRGRRGHLPAWATESTTETNVARHEAEGLIAKSRSRHWTLANTGLLTIIRTGDCRYLNPTAGWRRLELVDVTAVLADDPE